MITSYTSIYYYPTFYIIIFRRDGADETDVLQIREAFDALDEKKLGRIPISKLTKLGYANPEELFIRDPDNEKSSLLINRECINSYFIYLGLLIYIYIYISTHIKYLF